MADFSTEAELSIVVPRRELRSARQEVEDALAEVPVGMSASGGAGGSATNAAREQRRRRREFRWARQRTDDTEAQLEVLENIEGELTEGGLGGGGGIFGDLLGLGGEGAGIATDLGTSVVDAVAPALGSLVGTFVGQKASDATGGGGGGDLQIQEPLGVSVKNTPLDVEDGSDVSVSVETPDLNPTFDNDFSPTFNPEFSPTFNPEFSPTFNPEFSPEANILSELEEVNFGRSGSGLSEPVDVIITNTPLSIQGQGGRTGNGGTGGFFETLQELSTGVNLQSGDNQFSLGLLGGTFTGGDTSFQFGLAPPPKQGEGGGSGRNVIEGSTGDVNVTVNADVQSAVQSTIDELRREQEQQRQELRRELENEIQDLRRQISGGSGRGRIR